MKKMLVVMFVIAMAAACGKKQTPATTPDPAAPAAGETPAGEMPAGETPAGETPAGETPAETPQ
jgi:hypothetical protein